MEMQGLKPSVLIGKLKQHVPHGVIPDNDLFLAMFLICLPPSMRKAVSARNHKTAVAMVRAADTLWDAPASRKKNNRRNGNARSKSHPPSGSDFFSVQNLGNGMCKFHNFYSNKAHKSIFPCSYLEN
jgi:hypothetical protein